jgi:hypothetical protein
MNPLHEMANKYEELFSGWFKNLLGISVGALAVLVALIPDTSIPAPDKYPLVISWISLAVCIISSLIASFREVNLAHLTLAAKLNFPNLSGKEPPQTFKVKDEKLFRGIALKMKIIVISQFSAVWSFVISFVSLAVYGCLRTI